MPRDPADIGGNPSLVKAIPTLKYYRNTYAQDSDANDEKGVRTFKMYESMEQLRRLQNELSYIKDGKVSRPVLNNILGHKRSQKYQSYENWARLMLLWISQAKA